MSTTDIRTIKLPSGDMMPVLGQGTRHRCSNQPGTL
jgi:hypothetical protein